MAEVGSETAKNETGLASTTKPAAPAEPEFDVIPPGPVFVTITNSDAAAPINGLMAKNAFRMADYVFTGLPQKPEELFEPAPVPAPVAPAKPVAEAPAPANPPGK